MFKTTLHKDKYNCIIYVTSEESSSDETRSSYTDTKSKLKAKNFDIKYPKIFRSKSSKIDSSRKKKLAVVCEERNEDGVIEEKKKFSRNRMFHHGNNTLHRIGKVPLDTVELMQSQSHTTNISTDIDQENEYISESEEMKEIPEMKEENEMQMTLPHSPRLKIITDNVEDELLEKINLSPNDFNNTSNKFISSFKFDDQNPISEDIEENDFKIKSSKNSQKIKFVHNKISPIIDKAEILLDTYDLNFLKQHKREFSTHPILPALNKITELPEKEQNNLLCNKIKHLNKLPIVDELNDINLILNKKINFSTFVNYNDIIIENPCER